jgi:hypothetical protein
MAHLSTEYLVLSLHRELFHILEQPGFVARGSEYHYQLLTAQIKF